MRIGPAAQLPAVEREVVLERSRAAGGVVRRRAGRVAGAGHEQLFVLGEDAAERVVRGVPAPELLVPLVHREAMDPDVGQHLRVDQPEPLAELGTQPPEDVGGDIGRVGDHEDEVALVRAGSLPDPGRGLRREELGDGSLDLATGLDRQVGEALRAEPLRPLGQLVDLAARGTAHARRDDRLDAAARRERLVEHAEPRAALERRREVDQLHAEADVWLVGAEPFDDLVVREHGERHLLDRPFRCRRLADLDGDLLDEAHDRGLVDEAHLEVELGELRLAVAAQVLVAVAAGDLEVAVEPGDHEQLLELLWALRKRVDAARLETRRDDEVAGAFGRALDQRRRLDLDEPVRVVDLADRLDHPAAQQEAPLHRLAPDVEVAVLEAHALVDRGVRFIDVERRGLRLGQDLDGARPELDLARGELRVLRSGQPPGDLAGCAHHELRADPRGDRVGFGGFRRVHDDLGDPMTVAQVEEDQLAVVAAAMDPAGQARADARVGGAQLAAGMAAVWGRQIGWHGPQS